MDVTHKKSAKQILVDSLKTRNYSEVITEDGAQITMLYSRAVQLLGGWVPPPQHCASTMNIALHHTKTCCTMPATSHPRQGPSDPPSYELPQPCPIPGWGQEMEAKGGKGSLEIPAAAKAVRAMGKSSAQTRVQRM